ncbi:2'-5' RNA ligase family protein [Kitasatospora purpeofusca]|uniref:2'-5' RNA ligase family protein n=1 Tax=Kitasatospora purpeofusca TaxID=67352 RepID=UPI0035D6007A
MRPDLPEEAIVVLETDHKAFPAEPPSDLDDADIIVRTDWEAYTGLERLVNHWDRPGWDSRTRRLYWMLTFDGHRQLADRATECQRALQHLGLDLTPPGGLHITILRIGDTTSVPTRTVDALADRVRALRLPRLALSAHPLAGSRGAVRLSVTPWTGLVHLHQQLTTVGRALDVPGGTSTGRWRPHLGIGYNPSDRPARPLIDAVEPLRTLAPVPIDVGALDLVELRRGAREYRWQTVQRVSLS